MPGVKILAIFTTTTRPSITLHGPVVSLHGPCNHVAISPKYSPLSDAVARLLLAYTLLTAMALAEINRGKYEHQKVAGCLVQFMH